MTRRLAVWLVLLVLFVALIASAVASGGGSVDTSTISRNGVDYHGTVVQDGDSDTNVAMIPIYGTIVDGDSPADGSATGGDDLVRMLESITEDEHRWDGVILELDTPGGSVLASEEVTDAIERLRDKTDIPIVAWMRGTAASAGYYMSAPTDRIVAAPSTFTGSIGVILQYYVVDELADKVGIEEVTVKSGKLKDIGSPFRKVTAEERALFQTVIDEAYDSFVDVVARGRDLPEHEVRELADGRIYTGRQAEKNGLVDRLGLRRDAYAELAKLIDRDDIDGDDLQVVRFARSYGFFESLSAQAQPSLDGLAAAGAVSGLLRGDDSKLHGLARGATSSSGIAHLEYRAVL